MLESILEKVPIFTTSRDTEEDDKARCGEDKESTGCILEFKTHMKVKIHLTLDKDRDFLIPK